MSYKTELQSNNVDLQSALSAVQALPEASMGLETTTVSIAITNNSGSTVSYDCAALCLNDGAIESNIDNVDNKCNIDNVIVGSICFILLAERHGNATINTQSGITIVGGSWVDGFLCLSIDNANAEFWIAIGSGGTND